MKKDEGKVDEGKFDEERFKTVIEKIQGTLNGMTVKQDTIAPCSQKGEGWTKLSMAVDSGACETVVDAEEAVPGYAIQQTKASKSGLAYASATGEEILNLGEIVLPMVTKENTKRCMRM